MRLALLRSLAALCAKEWTTLWPCAALAAAHRIARRSSSAAGG
jgi:hypothetical protein